MRVLSWNILAPSYAAPAYFPFTEARYLDPVWRRGAILDRLAAEDADVVCLQEIEPDVFDDASARLGLFTGRFLAKVGRPDGCAIFVRRTFDASPSFREILYSDTTGHGALAVVASGITIATTHLKWQPPEIPHAERLSILELGELCDAFVKDGAPCVVTGDLNAPPESTTLKVAFDRGLVDAYASMTNAYTANANEKTKRIDFILHSKHFTATPVQLPSIDEKTPLPSATEPSDHLAIRARLERV